MQPTEAWSTPARTRALSLAGPHPHHRVLRPARGRDGGCSQHCCLFQRLSIDLNVAVIPFFPVFPVASLKPSQTTLNICHSIQHENTLFSFSHHKRNTSTFCSITITCFFFSLNNCCSQFTIVNTGPSQQFLWLHNISIVP